MARGGIRKGAGRPKGTGLFGESTAPMRVPLSMIEDISKFLTNNGYKIPFYASSVQAGSPSLMADDYAENKIDINDILIKHPAATFLVRVSGDSMIDAHIHSGDVLVVDRSLTPVDGKIVVAAIDGHLTVKRIRRVEDKLYLMAENKDFAPIILDEGNELLIWGVVTNIIHSV